MKTLTKKVRFEVFKRDSFTCQYCGRKAPDVVLQIDHIEPVSKGGTHNIINLITSCKECNIGKSDKKISDKSVVEKQRKQLRDLQDRKEQLEMMFKWQKELVNLDSRMINQLADFWSGLVSPYYLTEHGIEDLKKLLNKFSLKEIMEAMRISVKQYVNLKDDKPTRESVEKAWNKIGGICFNRRLEAKKPYMKELFYIIGILNKRLSYFREDLAKKMLDDCIQLGADIESLKNHAIKVKNWTEWSSDIESFLEKQRSKANLD